MYTHTHMYDYRTNNIRFIWYCPTWCFTGSLRYRDVGDLEGRFELETHIEAQLRFGCQILTTFGRCPHFGDFEHHFQPYLLEMSYPQDLGDVPIRV